MSKIKLVLSLALVFVVLSCATYSTKTASDVSSTSPASTTKKTHSIYLIGDAGLASQEPDKYSINGFKKMLEEEGTANDIAIFLGDNIYPKGLPPKGDKRRAAAEGFLDAQVAAMANFKGSAYFIPGNHDWYSKGLPGLKRQEEYLEKATDNNEVFQPEKGCPIRTKSINDDLEIIFIDTQWYLVDWDKHPTINDDCDIKSRNAFFLELEGELKKNNEKTVIIATHHPAMTYGPHGGYFAARQHLFPSGSKVPLPILGSFVAFARAQGGVTNQDRYNQRYDELMDRLTTMAIASDRAIIVSGHEHTLQYIDFNNIKQIVSGAGSKNSPVALGPGAQFVSSSRGFAVLDLYDDRSSKVRFYTMDGSEASLAFTSDVHPAEKPYDTSGLSSDFEPTTLAKAYKEGTDKSDGYRWFWGDHYRYIYGTDVKVPVITLDEFMGGFTIERKGGGHQTRSLRLIDKDGRNFALRAVKKSAVQFLQTVAFKDHYVEKDFKETLTEDVLLDFYTSSHPFASFTVGPLSDAIGLFHTNPQLVYMPKHPALGKYNEEFGDELYIIEERPDDGFLDVSSFGTPDDIESTADMLANLRADEKYKVDEASYIKARLFDMLVGDWDRHQDQWRWSRFDISDDKKIYRPIPRDRDQVYSNYDGALLDFLKVIIPSTKQFQEFDYEQKDIKWLNSAGIKLDRALTQDSNMNVWIEQAQYIQQQLTDEVIANAFAQLPPEIQDETADEIMAKLKARLQDLDELAKRYYVHLSKLVIITATDKDDEINIERGRGETRITVSRIKDGKVQPPFKTRTVKTTETKEVWIYALDDDDRIIASGGGNKPVFIRVIGGQNNDVYDLEDGRRIKIYDHASKPNTIVNTGGAELRLKDIYSNNVYDFNKYIDRINMIVPTIGFNPDDGIKIGATNTYTVKGFKNDPYHRKHVLSAGYFFATDGFDFKYQGNFANTFGNWDLVAGLRVTSENFALNFFGFGNETANFDDDLGLDFNRVRTGILMGSLGVQKNGDAGSSFGANLQFERIEVEPNADRFVTQFFAADDPILTDAKTFGTLLLRYNYVGADNRAYPTRGLFFNLDVGATANLKESDRNYAFIKPNLEFFSAIIGARTLVLRTQVQGHFNIGDNFEFYQGAVLGANTGLRGYRLQRFTGESALALSADLRLQLAKFKTGLLPLKLGVFGGYDIGRVWLDGEDSNTWHDSVGGGLLLTAVDAISGQFGLFNSDDGLRFSFGFGFSL
ncbi:metallophosphoesterase [Gilvibacter sp.]|uniref:metallophosphoesterase n=1 Tax=Gilvibacter sp. TaxID=2729997 RepID=UPI0035BE4922